jgi:hypothetical protein
VKEGELVVGREGEVLELTTDKELKQDTYQLYIQDAVYVDSRHASL